MKKLLLIILFSGIILQITADEQADMQKDYNDCLGGSSKLVDQMSCCAYAGGDFDGSSCTFTS